MPFLRSLTGVLLCWTACIWGLDSVQAAQTPAPVLARLSFWLPPERIPEFERVYEAEILPQLMQGGLRPSEQRSRATIDSVFCRLFEFSSAADFVSFQAAQAEPEAAKRYLESSRQLAEVFGSTGEGGLLKASFGLYSMPLPKGQRAVISGGTRQGLWQSYGAVDGLPTPSVTSIMEDRNGQLWLGILGGFLTHYDGEYFTTFEKITGPVRSSHLQVLEDRHGGLWFFDLWGSLTYYDGTRLAFFGAEDGLADNNVTCALEDRQGHIWFSTAAGLSRYAPEGTADHEIAGATFTRLTPANGLPANLAKTTSMAQDRAGHLFFASSNLLATQEHGLLRFDGAEFTTLTVEDGLASNDVCVVLADRSGALWIGSAAGVSRYDGERFVNFTAADGLPQSKVISILEDSQGRLWFGTFGDGVVRYDGRKARAFTTGDGLANNTVQAMLEDRQGRLWFATAAGLSRYDGRRLAHFTAADGLARGGVMSIAEDRAGQLWFGTHRGGSRYDGKEFSDLAPLAGHNVTAIREDNHRHMWFGTSNGNLLRYKGTSNPKHQTAGKNFVDLTRTAGITGKIRSIITDRWDALWIATSEGVVRYKDGVFSAVTQRKTGFVFEDSDGYIWLGRVAPKEVLRCDGKLWEAEPGAPTDLHCSSLTTKDGLPEKRVINMLEDQQGHMWLSTFDGIFRYDGDTSLPLKMGTGTKSFGAIEEDHKGHLWFGSWGGGVWRYDGLAFQRLTKQDGLLDNAVQEIFEDSRGDIWITSEGGATRYRSVQTSPTVRLTGVMTDRDYGPVETIAISSDQDYLAFESSGSSATTLPERMVYVYRLLGYQDQWQWTDQRRVIYEDLPLGDYTFELKAVDIDLNYSAPTRVEVRVQPPYKRLVLWGALGLALFMAVWQSGRLVRRDRRLQQANSDLSRANVQIKQTLTEKEQAQEALVRSESMAAIGTLVAGAAHELNNPLGAAASLVQSVQEIVEEDTAEELAADRDLIAEHLAFSRQELERAKDIVASLLELSRQSQDYTEEVDLKTVVQDALRGLEGRYDAAQVKIEEDYPAQRPVVQGNFAQLVQVALNLVGNAIEALEGEAGTITLAIYAEGDQLVLSCRDTGVGMAEAVRQDIFKPFFTTKAPGQGTGLGLYVCHLIIERHGGGIAVESAEGQGTTFKIRLPARAEIESA